MTKPRTPPSGLPCQHLHGAVLQSFNHKVVRSSERTSANSAPYGSFALRQAPLRFSLENSKERQRAPAKHSSYVKKPLKVQRLRPHHHAA